jgi:hypothetical protein
MQRHVIDPLNTPNLGEQSPGNIRAGFGRPRFFLSFCLPRFVGIAMALHSLSKNAAGFILPRASFWPPK